MFNGNYLVASRNLPMAVSQRSAAKPHATKALRSKDRAAGVAKRGRIQKSRPLPLPLPAVAIPCGPLTNGNAAVIRSEAPQEVDSLLGRYMREAGEVPLLTADEEVGLAARIKRGDLAAREHMIRANLRFVVKIAREYENLGMPLLDLINEGNIGLMKAVEKFDPAKGGKLSTYAALWIRQQIRRALASQGKTIRLPIHVADRIYHLSQAEVRLRHQLGRDATDEELAEELGINPVKLARLRRAAARPASLDAPVGEDASATIADLIADENTATPFESLRDRMEIGMVGHLVDKLSEREARIIRCRFGLDGGVERTLEDVGRKFNLTRERIRQLQNLALLKLRKMLEETPAMSAAA